MPRLIVESSEVESKTYELADQVVTVGRAADNLVHIPHASVSGHHAELTLFEGDYKLVDLNSTNGCRINDERTTEGMLRNGDILQLGNILFRYESENVLSAPPLPKLEDALEIGNASRRPATFVNYAPFEKKSEKAGKVPVLLWVGLLIGLIGVVFFAYKLFTTTVA